MDADRNVEFLGEREVGFVTRVVRAIAAVLDLHLAEHRKLSGGVQAAQFRGALVLALAEGDARQDHGSAEALRQSATSSTGPSVIARRTSCLRSAARVPARSPASFAGANIG